MDAVGAASGLVTLGSLIIRVLILAKGLQGISQKCEDITQQLQTLRDVLQHVDREYTETSRLASTQHVPSIGFDVTEGLLESCISDCTGTCAQYETLLHKISTALSRRLAWLRSESELARLHGCLEQRKSTLNTVLISMRNVRYSYRNSAAAQIRPPAYNVAVSERPSNWNSGSNRRFSDCAGAGSAAVERRPSYIGSDDRWLSDRADVTSGSAADGASIRDILIVGGLIGVVAASCTIAIAAQHAEDQRKRRRKFARELERGR